MFTLFYFVLLRNNSFPDKPPILLRSQRIKAESTSEQKEAKLTMQNIPLKHNLFYKKHIMNLSKQHT